MIIIPFFYWKKGVFSQNASIFVIDVTEVIGSMWLVKAVVWQRQGAIPGSKVKVKSSWFPTALWQMEPFPLPFPLASRLCSGRTVCIPWHGRVVEERLVSWGLRLPRSSQPILVLAHPAKQQRFGVIGSERETNLVYSVLFHGEELKPVVWVVPETGDLSPMFDQGKWVTLVELCGKGPQALVPTCWVNPNSLKWLKCFGFFFFIIKQNSYSLWSANTGSSAVASRGLLREWVQVTLHSLGRCGVWILLFPVLSISSG